MICLLTFIGQLLALGNQLSQQLTVEWWIDCAVNATFIIVTAATVTLCMMPFNWPLSSDMVTVARNRSAARSTDCSWMAWHVFQLIAVSNGEHGSVHSLFWSIFLFIQFFLWFVLGLLVPSEKRKEKLLKLIWKKNDMYKSNLKQMIIYFLISTNFIMHSYCNGVVKRSTGMIDPNHNFIINNSTDKHSLFVKSFDDAIYVNWIIVFFVKIGLLLIYRQQIV